MTLPASGVITLNDVNVELGFSGTALISLNDSPVRTLFGVSSGAIDMADGYGKTGAINRRVSQSSDNLVKYYFGAQYWLLGAAEITIGEGAGSCTASFRFTNIAVPKDATIDAAYMTFRASGDESNVVCNTYIRGESSDNAATFSTEVDWAARSYYTDGTTWDGIAAWSHWTEYNTPSIASIIQLIVNRAGWASGNAMAFSIYDNWNNWSDYYAARVIAGWNQYDNSYAPLLHIECH
jgi:hypothetical protein